MGSWLIRSGGELVCGKLRVAQGAVVPDLCGGTQPVPGKTCTQPWQGSLTVNPPFKEVLSAQVTVRQSTEASPCFDGSDRTVASVISAAPSGITYECAGSPFPYSDAPGCTTQYYSYFSKNHCNYVIVGLDY
jgi:hypothetical protein